MHILNFNLKLQLLLSYSNSSNVRITQIQRRSSPIFQLLNSLNNPSLATTKKTTIRQNKTIKGGTSPCKETKNFLCRVTRHFLTPIIWLSIWGNHQIHIIQIQLWLIVKSLAEFDIFGDIISTLLLDSVLISCLSCDFSVSISVFFLCSPTEGH